MKYAWIMGLVALLAAPVVTLAEGLADHREQVAEVQSYLIPLTADMQSAEVLAMGLERLANVDQFDKSNVKKSAYLVDQSVNIARARALQLKESEALTSEERKKVRKAAEKLSDARETVGRMQANLEGAPDVFRRQNSQGVRQEAVALYSQIMDAQMALDGLPREYGVSLQQAAARSGG